MLHVVCAVLEDADGRVLLAQRLTGQHLAGTWEFPGGKQEHGESQQDALARELDEELGIRLLHAEHWRDVSHAYADREVALHVWRVTTWAGEPYGRLGQEVRWFMRDALENLVIPAANRSLVAALSLPERCLITGDAASDAAFMQHLERALQRGLRLVMLRGERALHLAAHAVSQVHAQGGRVLLNTTPERYAALNVPANGLHLNRHLLMTLKQRPEGVRWVSASCHDARELAQAEALGLDFVLLSPVLPTASHPGEPTLGWERFAELAKECSLPVYALGGVGDDELCLAKRHGAQGVAAIRAWW